MHKIVIAAVAALVLLTACTTSNDAQQAAKETATREQLALSTGMDRLTQSQQVPTFDYSQERQILIDLLTIRAEGSASTTAFYLEGVGLIAWCPSLGAPIPSTYQLTATQQYVDVPNDQTVEKFPIDQAEPTGVYPGDSAATWTLCLDDAGTPFAQYWEGYTFSTIATLPGFDATKRLAPSDITFQFAKP